MRVLNGSCDSPGVCQRFGWFSKPGGNILAAQLLELGKRDTGDLGKVLATTMPRIYSLLNDLVGSDEMEVVKFILEDCSWIWVGSRFAKAQEVVFEGPQNLAPYLHVVPADLAAFRELFVELGVRESLGEEGYHSILSLLAKEKQGSPLDSRQLAAVLWIVQHLADVNRGDETRELMVPDADGVLVVSSQLVYNDAPWLFAASRDLQPGWLRDSGKRLVYSKISNDVAERVGISSVRRSLLAESADFVDLGLHDGMEAFGQSESLTNRLKHIVEMYVDGPGILFELLQNADDAGAGEVCFLLDEASFGTSSVLSRQMADWQGPALYCYNDSVFKPEDLRAISRIGQNSKLDKPSAIGRFGLGFNSVYHFTDVPGFVSGCNVVLLDPHAANLPGITPAQPGLKINFVGKNLVKQFPDQFEPFLFFGCDLVRPFDGTLFRFPLRTSKAAARSEIKQEAYDLGDVRNLFSALRGTPEVLLFLRSLRSIKVYTRREMNGELVEVFKVERENGDYQEKELHEFVRGKELFLKKLERTGEKTLPSSTGVIKLATTSEAEGKLVSSWLVSSALGGGSAREFALAASNRGRGFVPWAGIAAKMTTDEEMTSGFEGRAFCFLPLPVKAGLPVHVNGYFELSANRRDIWYDGDMVGKDKLRSEWNISLLRDAAAPAYSRLLHRAALELGPGARYNSLWPVDSLGEPWELLVLEVYRSVTEMDLPVLYTGARGGKWISPKQVVFPDVSFPEMEELGGALVKAGLPLVEAPRVVVERFREVSPSSLRFFTPQLLRRLLITSRRTFERSVSVLALKYCLTDVVTPDDEAKLHGLQLVPMMDNLYGTLNARDLGARIILAEDDERELLRDSFSEMLADVHPGEEVFLKLKRISQNGVTNVFRMSPAILQELLPVVFPPEWTGKEVVSWTPGLHGHPTLKWMELFWSYLGDHLEELSPRYSSWPLLPCSGDRLLRLARGGPVIVDDGWSENLTSVLQKSGCFLLRSGAPVKLREFAHEASAHGVLLAMFSAAGGNLKTIAGLLSTCDASEVRELRQFLLQTRWFTSGRMDDIQLQVLRSLKVFQSSGDEFRCLNECKQLIAPAGVDEQLIGGKLVRAEIGKEEDILQNHLGLRKLRKQEFFRDHFSECIVEIPEFERMGAFQKAVKDLAETPLPELSRLAFVPTSSGRVEPPERLYDPRVTELQTLLDKQFFPAEEFQNRELLDVLVSLGLRRSLGDEGLLDSARSVELASRSDPGEASRKGKALFSHLEELLGDETSASSFKDEFWMGLSKISWCPVLQAPPNGFIPWLAEQETPVSSPKLARPGEDIWLVSGSMRILESGCSDLLAGKLGWRETPNASVLAHQLVLLGNKFRTAQKSLKEQAWLDENSGLISREVKNIYKLLHGFLDCQEMIVLQTMLEGQPWLWIGDGFVSGREVAIDSPANFHPYLHALPLELLEFRELFTRLGVREAFQAVDYIQALLRLAGDVKDGKLNPEQLTFVLSLLATLSEVLDTADAGKRHLVLIPDADCFLVAAKALVYNDAPWLTQESSSSSGIYRLVHPEVDNELARKLGARSLRYLSVVDQEMTSSLPCLGIKKIIETLSSSGSGDFLLFDLLQVADLCHARRVHFVFDDQEHSKQSLLQPNLSEFQGPALLMILEDVRLSTEEVCSLHSSSPLKFRGQTSRYGAGLFSAYRVSALTQVVSSGCLYFFDPSGRVLSPALADRVKDPTGNPIGKAFSLQGTGLAEKFSDQFQPFNINEKLSLQSKNLSFFRFPLRAPDRSSELPRVQVPELFNKFKRHSTNSLLFLKFVNEVIVSERGSEPLREMFSASMSPASAILRHPFEEKNWRKFQLSNIFGSSSSATKSHTIDVFFRENGSTSVTKWMVVQTLASGLTRDMALDRRYLHYQLTPVAGVAACISADSSGFTQSSFMSPLPLGDDPLKLLQKLLPVTIYGNFLPFTSGHLFNETLGDYPVKVGMLGSHTGPVLSDDIIRASWNRQLLHCVFDSYIELLQAVHHSHLGEAIVSYSFWPRTSPEQAPDDDARCLARWLIRPMYSRLVEMPLWQLHSGGLVKFSEGVFIAPSTGGAAPKPSVSGFLKVHYRVFTAPWELGKEAEEASGVKAMELTPGTLRSLIKVPSVAAAIQSVETQIDLLEYCCVDALPEELLPGGELQLSRSFLLELKGVTCPTANEFMVKLGTIEVWVANREQQSLLPSLLKRFLHPACLERPLLAKLFNSKQFQLQLNLKPFSPQILAENLRSVLPREWFRVSSPWVEWNREHPSDEWLRNLWSNVTSSRQELSLFDAHPLIPATSGESTLLVRVSHREVVFVPPAGGAGDEDEEGFLEVDRSHPWLAPVLSKLGVPVFHRDFVGNCGALECCRPGEGLDLVHVVLSKLVALKRSGSPSSSSPLAESDCVELFTFLATLAPRAPGAEAQEELDDEEIEVLRSLPIYKTVRGGFVGVHPSRHFTLRADPLLQPEDQHCLAHLSWDQGGSFYHLLGIPELSNNDVLVRCILPSYATLPDDRREKVLGYIYQDSGSLSQEVINTLKRTEFVVNGGAPPRLCTPGELVDPENHLLRDIFAEERWRFPGKMFSTPRWLQILRSAGLRSIQDPGLILECAGKLEELGKQDLSSSSSLSFLGNSREVASSWHVSDSVWSLASSLVEEIVNNLALVYSSNFCDSLSKIEFVPAESGFPVSFGGENSSRVLTSYSRASLLKDWPLSWTCCPLLARPSLVPPQFSWGALHLRSPPTFSVVIEHLQVVGRNSGEDVLSRWPNSRGSRSVEDVFGEILSHLETVWNELSSSDKKQLASLAFIPVANGTRLVAASSLYTKLGVDLAPFVFEVPRAYLSQIKLLSWLGTRHEPLASDMVSLLLKLQQACGYQPLNPNELQAVFSVLKFIASRGDLKPENVVVPDENSRLVHANSCAYVDAAGARLADKIDSSKARFVHPDLPEETCIVVGVKKLSVIVLEELDESEPLQFLDSLGEYSLSFVKKQLASSVFGEFVWSIIPDRKKTKEEVMEVLHRASLDLRFVKTIRTSFLLLPSRRNITKQGEHRALFYVNRTTSSLLAAKPPGFLSVPDLLALLVSELLESSTLCLPLAPLFNKFNDGEGSHLKQAAKLLAPGVLQARRQGAGAEKLLGKLVLPVDSKALQFCPLRPFYAGEIVGWRENGVGSEARYGRVSEDIRAPAGQPLYKIRAETSPGEVQLLASSNVFSFRGTGANSSSSGAGENPVVVVENHPASSSSSSSERTSTPGSESDQSVETLENGASVLDAAGYTQAISDILASLGLPLSLERQSLLEHTLSLQEQLNSANTLLAAEQARADAAVSQAEAVKSSWSCRICLGSEVETMLVPCGHVLCQGCSPSLSKCPFCRRFITSRHTMYRP